MREIWHCSFSHDIRDDMTFHCDMISSLTKGRGYVIGRW